MEIKIEDLLLEIAKLRNDMIPIKDTYILSTN